MSENNFRYTLVFFIIVLIGFQIFPVIRIVGAFKIYELFALILFLKYRTYVISDLRMFSLWVLFVLSPIISYVVSFFFIDIPNSFFITYKEARGSFKFDNPFFPLMQLVYMLFCYATLFTIYTENRLYENFERLHKCIVYVGTGIAIYSLFSLFVWDPVLALPSFIQKKTQYTFRSGGLSQEPSNYVIYQTWITLFVYYSKEFFTKNKWKIMMIINIASLIFSFSSALVAFVGVLLFSVFLCRNSYRTRTRIALICIFLVSFGWWILNKYDLIAGFNYVFIDKVQHFFDAPEYTTDSGSFRSYTSRIGFEIFKEHPAFGVGVGRSQFFMHPFRDKMGIITFGEDLSLGIFPHSLYGCVCAEQGVLGALALSFFYIGLFVKLWKYRNSGIYGRLFFIGGLTNIAYSFSNAVIYSLYLWVFLVLALGYFKYSEDTGKSLLEFD